MSVQEKDFLAANRRKPCNPTPDSTRNLPQNRERLLDMGHSQKSLASLRSVATGALDKPLDDHFGPPGWQPRGDKAPRRGLKNFTKPVKPKIKIQPFEELAGKRKDTDVEDRQLGCTCVERVAITTKDLKVSRIGNSVALHWRRRWRIYMSFHGVRLKFNSSTFDW